MSPFSSPRQSVWSLQDPEMPFWYFRHSTGIRVIFNAVNMTRKSIFKNVNTKKRKWCMSLVDDEFDHFQGHRSPRDIQVCKGCRFFTGNCWEWYDKVLFTCSDVESYHWLSPAFRRKPKHFSSPRSTEDKHTRLGARLVGTRPDTISKILRILLPGRKRLKHDEFAARCILVVPLWLRMSKHFYIFDYFRVTIYG